MEIGYKRGNDKANQRTLYENNMIRTIWLRLSQGRSHLEKVDCAFGAPDRISDEWTPSGTPETWPSRAASSCVCMTRGERSRSLISGEFALNVTSLARQKVYVSN